MKKKIKKLKSRLWDENGKLSVIKLAPSEWEMFQKINEIIDQVNSISDVSVKKKISCIRCNDNGCPDCENIKWNIKD